MRCLGFFASAAWLVGVAQPLTGQLHDKRPTYELAGLVVTASPVPRAVDVIATHVTVLRGAELRARGVTRVVDALRDVAGISVVRGGSFGAVTSVFFRGGESDYVQVLVDGVQMNQPGGAFDFSGLTLDNVDRIEIVRGPASALYGSDAMAGVIQIITRTGRGGLSGSASLRAGSFGRLDASAGLSGGTDAFGYGFSLARRSTDGVLSLNNRFRNTVFSGSARLRPDDRTTARLAVRYSDREYHFPTDGSGNVVDANAFTYGQETSVSFDVSRFASERLELRALLTTHGSDGGTDDQPDGVADTLGFYGFTSLDAVRRTAADLRANLHLASGTVITLGSELEQESQRSFNESLSRFGPSSGRSDNNRWNRAGYAHFVTEWASVAANAGARAEDNERFGGSMTYQVGASWAPTSGTRLRASLGTGVKEPTFFENFATGFVSGNPNLDPERSRSWEVGVNQEIAGGRVLFTGTYFDQAFRDLIQFTFSPPSPADPNYFNVAEAKARGVELGLDARVDALTVRADYTWLDSEVVDAGLDGPQGEAAAFVAGARMLRRPDNTGSLTLGYRVGDRATLSGTVRVVGERDDRDFSTFPATRVALSRYTMVDIGGEVTLARPGGRRPGFSLTFRAENLLDRAYQEVMGFPAPGRGLYLGGRITLGR